MERETPVEVLVQLEEGALPPMYASKEAAGSDVRAYLREPLEVSPGKTALVSTGIRMAIPEGYEIQVRPRSGLALKHGITVLNTPGTIDSDYRGEVKVLIINHGSEAFVVEHGMRIAQLVLAPVCRAVFRGEEELVATERGGRGFGHTGTH